MSQVFKTMWGAVGDGTHHPTFAEAIPAIAAAGYDGIVFALIAMEFDPGIGTLDQLADLCAEHDLEQVFMIMSEGDDVGAHVSSLAGQLDRVAGYRPRHVVAHTGKDSFDAHQRNRCFTELVRIEADLPFPVGHETHRTRILFNPWVTREVMRDHPQVRFVADLSHWVVVAERLLPDETGIIDALAVRSLHIDARVGHEQGPQVRDPRTPSWAHHVAAFEGWWSSMIAANPELVLVPEYGPPPYQLVDSADTDPSRKLWDICDWAAGRLRTMQK